MHGRADPTRRTADGELAGRAARRDSCDTHRYGRAQRPGAEIPCLPRPVLVLVDAQDQIAWRQDYPLIEGGPLKLEELEAAIAELE